MVLTVLFCISVYATDGIFTVKLIQAADWAVRLCRRALIACLFSLVVCIFLLIGKHQFPRFGNFFLSWLRLFGCCNFSVVSQRTRLQKSFIFARTVVLLTAMPCSTATAGCPRCKNHSCTLLLILSGRSSQGIIYTPGDSRGCNMSLELCTNCPIIRLSQYIA